MVMMITVSRDRVMLLLPSPSITTITNTTTLLSEPPRPTPLTLIKPSTPPGPLPAAGAVVYEIFSCLRD